MQKATADLSLRWRIPVRTALGVFGVELTPRGVAGLHFPVHKEIPTRASSKSIPVPLRRLEDCVRKALVASIDGRGPNRLPPLDWTGATPFQRKVWTIMLRIPRGRTISYGELARRMGLPGAARAVGAACGANPIPVFVPCHRVLAAHGRLGGFSSGLKWKEALLALESRSGIR